MLQQEWCCDCISCSSVAHCYKPLALKYIVPYHAKKGLRRPQEQQSLLQKSENDYLCFISSSISLNEGGYIEGITSKVGR